MRIQTVNLVRQEFIRQEFINRAALDFLFISTIKMNTVANSTKLHLHRLFGMFTAAEPPFIYIMDKIIFKLSTKIILAITIPCLFFISGCASYTENGELVRHHFGYVKVITPAVHAPESAVRSLEVETYGIWVNMDNRSDPENIGGFGTGLGYKYDRRDFIPLDCRVVIRVKTIEEFKKILKELQTSENQEGGICIIRD